MVYPSNIIGCHVVYPFNLIGCHVVYPSNLIGCHVVYPSNLIGFQSFCRGLVLKEEHEGSVKVKLVDLGELRVVHTTQ